MLIYAWERDLCYWVGQNQPHHLLFLLTFLKPPQGSHPFSLAAYRATPLKCKSDHLTSQPRFLSSIFCHYVLSLFSPNPAYMIPLLQDSGVVPLECVLIAPVFVLFIAFQNVSLYVVWCVLITASHQPSSSWKARNMSIFSIIILPDAAPSLAQCRFSRTLLEEWVKLLWIIFPLLIFHSINQ